MKFLTRSLILITTLVPGLGLAQIITNGLIGVTSVNGNAVLASTTDTGGIVMYNVRIQSKTTTPEDFVSLTYALDLPTLGLALSSVAVYPNVGVTYIDEAIFVKDVPAEFTLTRGATVYQSSSQNTVNTTNDVPLRMNLQAGTTLGFRLRNPSRNYHFIIQKADTGEILRDSYYLAGSDFVAYQIPILAAGEYLLFFQSEDPSGTMQLQLTAYNSNRFTLSNLVSGNSFSASFREASGDYRKWKIRLLKGQTLTMNRTSSSGEVDTKLVFEDSTASYRQASFFTFAYVAEKTGDYFLVCKSVGASASSCSGSISISAPSLSFSQWRNMNSFPPGGEKQNADPDNDGLTNFTEYALDTNPMSATSNNEYQKLTVNSGSVSFDITKPKFVTGARYAIYSSADVRNMNNRSIEITPSPSDAGKEIIRRVEPRAKKGFFQLRINE